MKNLCTVLMASLFFLYACHSKDPDANLLIGSWNQTEMKAAPDSAWRAVSSSWGVNVVFKRDGTVSTENRMPFSGGWCNYAERYALQTKTILLNYGEPNCIPIIYLPVPTEATVLELTDQSLTLDYGGRGLKFNRK